MSKATRLTATVLSAALGVAALAGPAAAQAVKVGTLTCNVASGFGFILGSSKSVNCTYAGVGGHYEHYVGNITKIGADIGYTAGGILVWTVVAPVGVMVPGALTLIAASVLDRDLFNAELEADWRTHFEALTDAQLGEVNPDLICAGLADRIARLKQAYSDEVARRKRAN